MNVRLTAAYHESIELRDTLEYLYRLVTGAYPTANLTPRDMRDRIEAALTRQRDTADAGQRELFEGDAE